jgi:hypothetical protein
MTGTVDVPQPPARGALWFAMLGGPAGWSAHLLASYPLVPVACTLSSVWLLHVVTLLTAGVAAAAGVVGWKLWRAAGTNREPDAGDPAMRRASFMALSGMALGAFFAFVTIVEGLPVFFGHPCLQGP